MTSFSYTTHVHRKRPTQPSAMLFELITWQHMRALDALTVVAALHPCRSLRDAATKVKRLSADEIAATGPLFVECLMREPLPTTEGFADWIITASCMDAIQHAGDVT